MIKNFILPLVALSLSSCASMGKSDATVQQGMAAFQEAFNKHDAAALAKIYADDARLMPSNAPMMTGRARIQSYWQTGFSRGVTSIAKTPVDVQIIGDTAIEMSNYVATIGDHKIKGKDMLVWKKGGDGQWRIAADIWNNDQP